MKATQRRFLVALAFVLGSIPSPALAHTSSYCGHGVSGTFNIVEYTSSFNISHGHWTPHHHRYDHSYAGIYTHSDVKHCSAHSWSR